MNEHHPLDSTRKLASQALERAGNTVAGLRSGVHDFANRSMSTVSERASAAQRHLGEYAHTSGRYVAEHPVKSALIAAAIGAAVAGLVLALRHRRQDSDYI